MWKPIAAIAILLMLGALIFNMSEKSKTESKSAMSIDISIKELKEKRAETEGIIIDVRTEDEYKAGHLAEADFQYDLLNGDFEAQLDSLDKDETYFLYCRSGNRSGQAARLMKSAGFEKVYNAGGYEELVDAGFKTEQ